MKVPTQIQIGSNRVVRFNLENDSAPRGYIAESIKILWRKYEPWASGAEIYQTISKKTGRVVDLVYDASGNVSGFYIFRVFRHKSWRVMFRGNSYSDDNVKGIGAPLFKLILKQYEPDRIVTFTPQMRACAFLSYFGELVPSKRTRVTKCELEILSQLAGPTHHIDPDTLIVRDFYRESHDSQGNPVRDEKIKNMFSLLGKRDAYAIVLRCEH